MSHADQDNIDEALSTQLVAGGLAGGAAAAITTPLDVVKTRLQLAGLAGLQQSTAQRQGQAIAAPQAAAAAQARAMASTAGSASASGSSGGGASQVAAAAFSTSASSSSAGGAAAGAAAGGLESMPRYANDSVVSCKRKNDSCMQEDLFWKVHHKDVLGAC